VNTPRPGGAPPSEPKPNTGDNPPASGRFIALLGLGAVFAVLLVFSMLMISSLEQLSGAASAYSFTANYSTLQGSIGFIRYLLWGALGFFALFGLLTQILLARVIDARNASEQKVRDRTADLVRSNDQLQVTNRALARQTNEIRSLNTLVDLLQAARNTEEANSILEHQLPSLFPSGRGGLYLINASRNLAEAVAGWGDPVLTFPPDDCWSLRLGRSHQTASGNPRCTHWDTCPPDWQTLCIPLIAGGETQGVLTLADSSMESSQVDFAQILSEQLGLSVANLKLRETLRQQSIRDELTGLYNRRYFDETLDRELSRIRRSRGLLAMLMIDLDHFKRFNDEFGHKAGDAVLQALAHALGHNIRTSDVPCRYGGEEFSLVLPDTSLEYARDRAEQIRHRIEETKIEYDGRRLPSMTASFGVAVFPLHAQTAADLVGAADRALYQAKEAGRNRVVVADKPVGENPEGGIPGVGSEGVSAPAI
jgi:diguanylate cyclase (GGDEF)-like protein